MKDNHSLFLQFEIRYEAEKSVLINYFYQKIKGRHRCVVHSAVLWYDTTSVTTTPTNLLGLDVLFGHLSTFLKDSAASVYGLEGL